MNLKPVIYRSIRCRCPACDAKNPRIYWTGRRGVRYHLCHDCGHTFKSMDETYLLDASNSMLSSSSKLAIDKA